MGVGWAVAATYRMGDFGWAVALARGTAQASAKAAATAHTAASRRRLCIRVTFTGQGLLGGCWGLLLSFAWLPSGPYARHMTVPGRFCLTPYGNSLVTYRDFR